MIRGRIECFRALYYFENQIETKVKTDYFTSFFDSYRDTSMTNLKYREFPVGNSQSEIQLFVKRKSSTSQLLSRQFAWITAAGLYYTEIDPNDVQKSFLEKSRIIDYYVNKSVKQRDEEKPPKSVALTEYHCLMMFPNENEIRAVCTVNETVVMRDGAMDVSSIGQTMEGDNRSIIFSMANRFVLHGINCVINCGNVRKRKFFDMQSPMKHEMFGGYLCKRKNFPKHWKHRKWFVRTRSFSIDH